MRQTYREVMHMDANKLKTKLSEKGFSISTVANLMNLCELSLHKKLNGSDIMTVYDAMCLKEILNLTNAEALDIFLSKEY